jgi:ABC-2 type transport system ATP-binding protein
LYAAAAINILCLTANRSPTTSPAGDRATVPTPEAAVSVIETQRLVKTYGRVEALKGVSIRVEPGEIYGLLGQNGAGKTTLIKILLGIVQKTDGDAALLGEPAGTVHVRQRVGYLPEDHRFPEYHTGYSLMDFYGQLYGLPRDQRRRKIPEMLEVVGIRNRMDSRIRTYSKGMKQRLGIAQAMFHDPQVIFLDEPTDGVDPVGRREIRELMERLKAEGKTIFLNSHLLGEVEQVCDRVAILQKGQLARQGTVADLTKQVGLYVVGLAPGQAFPADEVTRLGFGVRPDGDRVEVTLPDGQTIDPVLGLLQAKGLSLRHLVEKKQTLEDVFVSMVDADEPGTDRRERRPRQVGGADRRRK